MKTPEHIQRIQKRKNEILNKWEMRGFSLPGEITLMNAWLSCLRIFEEAEKRKELENQPSKERAK